MNDTAIAMNTTGLKVTPHSKEKYKLPHVHMSLPSFKIVQLNAIERKMNLKMAEDNFRATHFSKDEVVKLLNKYRSVADVSKMDRGMFRDILHTHFVMSDDFFMDRVFRAFDKDSDGFLSLEEWVKGLSIFLRGTLEEKVRFCFDIYDLNDDGYISREEMFQMLKTTMVKQSNEEDPDEGIKDLVEIMVKRMDHDHDSKVSLDDFRSSIKQETLLIEGFGPCLPSNDTIECFSNLMFEVPQD